MRARARDKVHHNMTRYTAIFANLKGAQRGIDLHSVKNDLPHYPGRSIDFQ